MGAEASTVGELGSTKGSRHLAKGIPWAARSKLIAKWRKRQNSTQLFAVARHVERADGLYATVQGGLRWTQTEDFQQWPLDPPISDDGIGEAKVLGQKLRGVAEETGAAIPVVICSPYFRCIQTAVEICRELGPQVRMLIDRELGEVYGPAIMGHQQPVFPVRPIETTREYCLSRGVTCHAKLIGKWPAWPEDLKSARHRYANRFLTYLQRSSVTRRNFILVTHADCVGAALSTMPSQMDHAVQSVEYGGTFVARRLRSDTAPAVKGRRKSLPMNFAAVVPSNGDSEDIDCSSARCESSIDWETLSDTLTTPKVDSWLRQGGSGTDLGSDTEARVDDMPVVELPEASDGWQVHTHQINLCKKAESTPSKDKTSSRFTKRVKTLAKNTSFSKERIAKLLGELSEKTLGGEDFSDKNLDRGEEEDTESTAPSRGQRTKTAHTVASSSYPTQLSFSTFLFGSSDVANMSDCGSSHISQALSYRMQDLEDILKSQPGSPRNHHRSSSRRWSESSSSLPRMSDSMRITDHSSPAISRQQSPQSPVSLNCLLEERMPGKGNEDPSNSDLSPRSWAQSKPVRKLKKKRLSWAKDVVSESDGGLPLDIVQEPQTEQVGKVYQDLRSTFGHVNNRSTGGQDLADLASSDAGDRAMKMCSPAGNLTGCLNGTKPSGDQLKVAGSVINIDGQKSIGDERKAVPLKDFDKSMLLRRRNIKLASQKEIGEVALTNDPSYVKQSAGQECESGQEASGSFRRTETESTQANNALDPAGKNGVDAGCQSGATVISAKYDAAERASSPNRDERQAVNPVVIVDVPKSGKHEDKAVPFKSLDGSMLMRRRNMKLTLQTGSGQ